MRTIIAGSRTILRMSVLETAMERLSFTPSVVISGCAIGVDRLGEAWAMARSIPIDRFPADWTTYGRRAGFIRNALMAENADALVALWDSDSPGTKHMIKCAGDNGLRVFVFTIKDGAIFE